MQSIDTYLPAVRRHPMLKLQFYFQFLLFVCSLRLDWNARLVRCKRKLLRFGSTDIRECLYLANNSQDRAWLWWGLYIHSPSIIFCPLNQTLFEVTSVWPQHLLEVKACNSWCHISYGKWSFAAVTHSFHSIRYIG